MKTEFLPTSIDRALEQRERELAREYKDADVQIAIAGDRALSDIYWATLHFA